MNPSVPKRQLAEPMLTGQMLWASLTMLTKTVKHPIIIPGSSNALKLGWFTAFLSNANALYDRKTQATKAVHRQ